MSQSYYDRLIIPNQPKKIFSLKRIQSKTKEIVFVFHQIRNESETEPTHMRYLGYVPMVITVIIFHV